MSDDGAEAQPDAYDKASRVSGFGTMNGEVVKSEGERLIADWLFLNGVDYRYEHPYTHDVADETHSQYRPDFFYPDVDVWHEHWALGRDGNPPAEFVGYAESMAWKKATHRQFGTTLIETTWAEIVDTTGFGPLHDQLAARGVEFDWNPDRAPDTKAMSHESLAKLVRTFMAHVKSNGFTRADLEARWARSGRSYRSQCVPRPLLADPRRVAAPAARRRLDRLRGHADRGRQARRGRDRHGLRDGPGRRVPGRQPGPRPARPCAGGQAAPLPDDRRRRLAGHQPVRRGGHLRDDRLQPVVRRRSDLATPDHLPLHPDHRRHRRRVRAEEPPTTAEGGSRHRGTIPASPSNSSASSPRTKSCRPWAPGCATCPHACRPPPSTFSAATASRGT